MMGLDKMLQIRAKGEKRRHEERNGAWTGRKHGTQRNHVPSSRVNIGKCLDPPQQASFITNTRQPGGSHDGSTPNSLIST